MKIRVISKGETEFTLDPEYQEPAIREAIEDGCNDVASQIVDYTDTERSNISHDEHATVTEDDGTVLWSGWLGGIDDDTPPLDPIALGQLAWNWEALAGEEDKLADFGNPGTSAEHARKAAMLRDCARQLREALEGVGRQGGAGPRGNSYANGASVANGPCSPWSWRSGFQAPRPVTHWDFAEGRLEA